MQLVPSSTRAKKLSCHRVLAAMALVVVVISAAGCVSRGVPPNQMPKPWPRAVWEKDVGRASKGLARSPWPATRCDAMRTSQSSFPGPRDSKIKWTYRSRSGELSGIAVGPDGSIYMREGKSLLALSAAGKVRWRRRDVDVAGEAFFGTGPSISADGKLIVSSLKKRICCFDTAGKLLWATPVSIDPEQGAEQAIGPDGTVYVGYFKPERTHLLVALRPDGSVKWTVRTPSSGNPPIIDPSGRVWFGGRFFGPRGKQTAGRYEEASVLGPGGVTYSFVETGTDLYSSDGVIHRENPDGTRPGWDHQIGSAPGQLALSRLGILYATESDGYLSALNAETGKLLWRTDVSYMGGNVFGPSIDSEGTVYVCALESMNSGHATVSARRADGTVAWRMRIKGSASDFPAIGTGRTLLVCTGDFSDGFGKAKNPTLYCIGEP